MSTRLLFVCLGNICRSPSAEAVMRQLVEQAGLSDDVELDSAGTGAWHVGQPPDQRARAAAARRAIPMTGTARQIRASDFDEFDFILAMDAENLRELRRLAPPGSHAEVRAFGTVDVPDPYYGGDADFDEVFDIVEVAARALLEELRQTTDG